MINVHHLELFYYVAKHEGIVAACRQMPYGIQQPAMSAQVAALEKQLGLSLFERRPFRLTAAGRELYEFAAPFFGRLDEVEERIQGRASQILRLAGLTEVMREHVPVLLADLRKRFPGLRLTLQEIAQDGAERLIAQGEADLAITVLESRLPPGFRSLVLARLPMGLLVPVDFPRRRAADLIRNPGSETLIALPPHELLPRLFQKEMAQRGWVWKTGIEASSQDLVTIYVRNGLGVGLAVRTPDLERDPQLRVLPLTGFPVLPIGAFWRGTLAEPAAVLVEELTARVQRILGKPGGE